MSSQANPLRCDIIGHNHHPRKTETHNFQILYEADWPVNMEENGLLKNSEKLQEIIEKNFETVTGKNYPKNVTGKYISLCPCSWTMKCGSAE